MKKFLFALFAVLLLLPMKGYAEQQVAPWLTLGGDFQARYDLLQGSTPSYLPFGSAAPVQGQDYRNNSLLTNRFGINMKAKVLENVDVKARLLMYKVWGSDSSNAVTSHDFFLDRAGVFDGDLGHVPSSDFLNVDYAYATWFNIADQPIWFSIGRRPSTNGIPGNLRRNAAPVSLTAGTPNFLIDYAFDGLSLGYAPYIKALPGAYIKFCAGKGFDSGFINHALANQLHDTTMVGINIVPYNTDQLEVQLQWDRAIDIFDAPPDYQFTPSNGGATITLQPGNNLGNIDQFGAVALGQIKNVHYFVSGALSMTHPNGNQATAFEAIGVPQPFLPGLLNDAPALGGDLRANHTGWATYIGVRYDIDSTRTKIGAEYNHGSRNWIAFAPAGDDIWTSKVGARGNVYELYVIQELHAKPVDKLGLAFFRLGWQYYDFQNTGSNDWNGASISMQNVTTHPQLFTPIKNANDVYLTFNVDF